MLTPYYLTTASQNNVHELIMSSSSNTRLLNTRSGWVIQLALCGSPAWQSNETLSSCFTPNPVFEFNLTPVHWSRILAALIITWIQRNTWCYSLGKFWHIIRGSANKNKEMVFTQKGGCFGVKGTMNKNWNEDISTRLHFFFWFDDNPILQWRTQ